MCDSSLSPGEYFRCVQQELCYQLHLLQKCLPSLDPRPLLSSLPQQSVGWEGQAVKTLMRSWFIGLSATMKKQNEIFLHLQNCQPSNYS